MSETGKRILIVEDQRIIAADIGSTLRKLGYEVAASVASGEDAVRKASEIRPDLILMDIRLRGNMDGIQAAEAIRARSEVPIVYLTAYADEETILRASKTSPFGYLVKPFNERELRAAIEIAISKHETDRLLVEERARRRAAEEFKLLVECVKDYAIIMLDASGRVASWNEGAVRITGYAAEEIRGRHLSVFYLQEDVDAGEPESVLQAALREGRAEFEGWQLRKEGSRFWANVVLTAIRDESGRLHGFGKITRDLTERRRDELALKESITEQKRAEERLREAIRARDEFLQIASHELKTPLTPLQLQLDTLARALERAGVQNERLSHKLEIAVRQAARLARLVESLLDVSRITAGQVVLEVEPLDLAELVRDVAERFRPEARKVGSEVTVHAEETIAGHWDRLRVEQILSNLLANAIKYGHGKSIEIEARVTDGTVRISITDHGIGIDKDVLGRIFGRFERAVSMRHFGGMGLGLFIARQFAEAHGGSIVAQSQPDVGSTFTVVLPLDAAARPGAGPIRQETTQ